MINDKDDYNFADILQLFGQWLVSTGDFVSLVGQGIAIEQDRLEKIQEEKEKEEQQQQQQQMQDQMEQMQQQIELLQKQLD